MPTSPRQCKPRASPPPGYLKATELPDSIALLPRPPELGSPSEALDLQIASAMLMLRDTPRFALAALDADLSFPAAAGTFSCTLGAAITAQDTPTLYRLLIRVMSDAGAATGAAKDKYQHARPFMLDGEPTCRPSDEARLRKNGSYPSGHTSIGWAWALVLAEVAPDRAEAILERGRAFGESRLVCNAHWASDVLEGRIVGTATAAREHGSPEFRADVEAARDESSLSAREEPGAAARLQGGGGGVEANALAHADRERAFMPDIDALVVGAGVVGIAVARALALNGRSVIVIERADRIGSETSSRNSEVIHSGIYYRQGQPQGEVLRHGPAEAL